MFNYFFYIFQCLVWSWFFSNYLKSKNPGKNLIRIWLFYLLIIYPVAFFLFSHFAFKSIVLFCMVFVACCLVFPQEKKTKILLSVCLYQLGILVSDFMFVLFLYSYSMSLDIQFFFNVSSYPILFPILQCIEIYLVFKGLLFCFQKNGHIKNKICFILSCVLFILQIFGWMSGNFVRSDKLFILYCIVLLILFIGTNIVLLVYLLHAAKEEKLKYTLDYLDFSYKKTFQDTYCLLNKESYRKLRHDYINFCQSKEIRP